MNDSEPTNDPELTQWENQLRSVALPGQPVQRDELFYQSGYAAAQAEAASLKHSVTLWRSCCLATAAAMIVTVTLMPRPVNDNIAAPEAVIESSESFAVDAPPVQPLIPVQPSILDLQREDTLRPASHSLMALSQQIGHGLPLQRSPTIRVHSNVIVQPRIGARDIAWAMEEI